MFVYLEHADEQQFILIESVGRWVFTQQGAIGERAPFSSIESADVAAARATVQLLVEQAEKGEFVRVDARSTPRVLLVDGHDKSFAWFQIKDTMLLEASGSVAELHEQTPRALFASSEDEAETLRTDKIHALQAAGYHVVFFGLGPLSASPAKKKKKAPASRGPVLAPLPVDLREAVLDDPDNAEHWSAVADWVEEARPLVRHLIEAERAGKAIDTKLLEPADAKLLLGKAFASIAYTMHVDSKPLWKATHVAACTLTLRGRRYEKKTWFASEAQHFADIASAPAFACLHTLDLRVDGGRGFEALLPLMPQLRSLRIEARTYQFDWSYLPARFFASGSRLQSLTLAFGETGTFRADDDLGHVGHLVLQSPRPLSVLSRSLGGLRSLVVDLRLCVTVSDFVAALDRIAVSAPNLTWLMATVGAGWLDGAQTQLFLAALERSALCRQLRHLYIATGEQPTQLTSAQRAAFAGGAFAHLEVLELSERYARHAGAVS